MHVAPNDIRFDARILKELNVIDNEFGKNSYVAVGLELSGDRHNYVPNVDLNVVTFRSLASGSVRMNRLFVLLLNLFTSIPRLILIGLRYRPRLIHCHDTLFLPICVVLKYLCNSTCLVYDAHELESDKGGQSNLFSKATLFLEKICWPSVDCLISVSPSILNWYGENFAYKDKHLILNALAFGQELNEDRKYLREKFKIGNEYPIFIYSGALCEGRYLHDIIDCFSHLKHKHLVVLGYGRFQDYIESKSHEFDNIHFHDAVPYQEVVGILKSADIGLCLINPENSLSDLFCLPNKFFEYHTAGIPVITTDLPDLSYYSSKYKLGIILRKLENLPEIVANFEIGSFRTEREYTLSWEYQSETLIKVYKKYLVCAE